MSYKICHLPFISIGEVLFHIDMSNILVEQIRRRIIELPNYDGESKDTIENYITDSLSIVVEGYTNMLLSIQQGYLK
jgi:hypothetical protein